MSCNAWLQQTRQLGGVQIRISLTDVSLEIVRLERRPSTLKDNTRWLKPATFVVGSRQIEQLVSAHLVSSAA